LNLGLALNTKGVSYLKNSNYKRQTMRKDLNIIIFVLCNLLIVSISNVQGQVHIAIQGGISKSKLNDTHYVENNRTGYNIGIYIEPSLNKKKTQYLNTGLVLNLKGDCINEVIKSNYYLKNILYMNIPLTYSYKLNLSRNRLAILPYAGFYGGIVLSANYSWRKDSDFIEELKSCDYGLILGLSVELFNYLQVAIEYNKGLLDIHKISDHPYYNEETKLCLRLFFN
jgi:hypothetical protein